MFFFDSTSNREADDVREGGKVFIFEEKKFAGLRVLKNNFRSTRSAGFFTSLSLDGAHFMDLASREGGKHMLRAVCDQKMM
jgi:hypothetical protein